MTSETDLPWDALETTDEVPWPALERLAQALAEQPGILPRLRQTYDEACITALKTETHADLFVLAICALAAPRLDAPTQQDVAAFLVEKLVEAGDRDWDYRLEELEAVCGALGPGCVPAVLRAIADEPDCKGAWFFLWNLTQLAAHSDDDGLRRQVVDACMNALRDACDGPNRPGGVIGAANTLGKMRHAPARPLIQTLAEQAGMFFSRGDMEEALVLLDGKLAPDHYPEIWETPLRELVENSWERTREWFKKDRPDADPDDPELALDLDRISLLVGRFCRSPHGAEFRRDPAGCARDIADTLLSSARVDLRLMPHQLDMPALRQLLLHVLPEEAENPPEFFEQLAPVTTALLRWLESEGILSDAAPLAEAVAGWSDEIVANAAAEANWSDGKRHIVMHPPSLSDGPDDLPPMPGSTPIARDVPKVGRNDPCPCGSGKKYKHCCGK